MDSPTECLCQDTLVPSDRHWTATLGPLVPLTDGRLLIVQAGLQVSFSSDLGRTWSEAGPLCDGDQPIVGEKPGLLRLQSGALALTYGRTVAHPGWFDDGGLYFRLSRDDAQTWSPERRVNPPGAFFGDGYYDVLVQLKSGRLLLPAEAFFIGRHRELEGAGGYGWLRGQRVSLEGHGHVPEMQVDLVYISDDEGQTWSRSTGELMGWHRNGYNHVTPLDEPNLVELKDGRALMFMRTTIGRIVRSVSEDGGRNWGLVEPTDLASSYSPSRLRRIPSTGDLLVIWNQVSGQEIRRGFRRGRLSSAISRDEGATWTHFKTLECCIPHANAQRVHPDPDLRLVRGEADSGDLPEDFAAFHYANVGFAGDQAFLQYSVIVPDRDPTQSLCYRRLRRVPVEWFYQGGQEAEASGAGRSRFE